MTGCNRHHYVPRLIIDRFVDSEGMLHVYDKRHPEKGVRAQSPRDTFVQKHLYSIKRKDGTRDRTLESWFSSLEGAIAPVIEKIVAAARANAPAGLSDEQRQIWDYYLAMQWRRVPEIHEHVMDDEAFERAIAESVAGFELRRGPLTEDERRWAQHPSERPYFRDNVIVGSLTKHTTGRVFQTLQQRGMAVFRPERRDKSFILSSRPVLRAGPRHETLAHPEIEVWLALAPDVAVTAWGHRGVDQLRTLTTLGVRRLNRALAQQSRIIASGASPLVSSLSRPR